MKLGRILINQSPQVVSIRDGLVQPVDLSKAGLGTLGELLSHPDLIQLASSLPAVGSSIPIDQADWVPPIDEQEVWAAGVTYKRSQAARMEESEAAASCYDRVYGADRPELFFKATPSRCRGHRGKLRIRADSHWNVPEPELTLVISRDARIVGYTIGNDMSSRDIEGDNPLYLPQAKFYSQCCGLGPWITLAEAMPERASIMIRLSIQRNGQEVFSGTTSIAQLNRELEDLVQWLFRDNEFPNGVMLLTGTGIVPDSSFTLARGDLVAIEIDGIGRLENTIEQSTSMFDKSIGKNTSR